MSKKPQYDPEEIRYPNQTIVTSPLVPEMEKSYIEYAMSVIVGRALPDVRDGLKPVHRRILYAMYEDNLTHDKPFKKSATCVGDVLGRYHPHGDGSVYDALVRLAQDFSMRYPLVDGHGNFGSIDGDPPAAYRYTEARMSKISNEMLRDIEKDTVNWDPNFDETRKEPRVLPSRFPNLLVNGSAGIAVGMATNIPPHNLREVIDAAICVLDNPEATLADLMEQKVALDLEKQQEAFEKDHAKLQYYQLQTRSHFMANCLKSLYAMLISRQYEKMQMMIIAFSNHLRYIFNDTLKLVPLKAEMEALPDCPAPDSLRKFHGAGAGSNAQAGKLYGAVFFPGLPDGAGGREGCCRNKRKLKKQKIFGRKTGNMFCAAGGGQSSGGG